ncbi:MAG TPA: 16S rRNA (guanine(966)-N(2))-methyltransferase RsmD [Polyangiaceae bacterium]|nr:16S rRNA (guanine(966)-N(2))-methyltransferase RsmD [Polyangiaceae bacterium]
MRIIAGRFRGRPIVAPEGMTTRPTTDRAREAIFNILGPLDGENVVDCFAGTGALGIESLSRGARHATFVETDRNALRAIQKNLEKLGVTAQATVLDVPVEKARARLERLAPFDVVLADPPWKIAQDAAERVSKVIRGLLAPGARVLLGHPTAAPIALGPESGLTLVDRRKWGGSGMSFFEETGEPKDSERLEA